MNIIGIFRSYENAKKYLTPNRKIKGPYPIFDESIQIPQINPAPFHELLWSNDKIKPEINFPKFDISPSLNYQYYYPQFQSNNMDISPNEMK